MTEAQGHPRDELQLLLDRRLDVQDRRAVEAHLAECARCRRELEALRRVTTALRQDLPQHPVPTDLATRVSAALRGEAAGGQAAGERVVPWRRRRVFIGVALAAAAALVLLLVRPGHPDFVRAAAGDFAAHRTATLRLDLETAEPAALERYFADARVPFPTRVFDFGMMGYGLTGGRVDQLAGRPSALFAYEGPAGQRLLCQMYEGAISELPSPAVEREHNGIRFLIYRTSGLTLVFWQEGTVVCVLVGEGDPEATIQFAYAKAVKV